MPDSINSSWRGLLSVPRDDNTPLLCRTNFETDSYSIQLTDLSYIWTEKMDKQQILTRAREDETSIDPSEDDSQFRMVLGKIKAAIDGGPETHLSVHRDASRNAMRLSIAIDLPRPLQPFKWTIRLRLAPELTIASELISPLLRSSYVQYQRVEELARLLQEKDSAIAKMLDKVQSLGIDLHTMFPNASSSRGSRKENPRNIILKNVRGMETFEKDKWLREFFSNLEVTPTFHDLIRDAFAGETAENEVSLEALSYPRLLEARPKTPQRDHPVNMGASSDSSDSENRDGFQRQVTPPSMKKLRNNNIQNTGNRSHEPDHAEPHELDDDATGGSTLDDDANPPPHASNDRAILCSSDRHDAIAEALPSPNTTPRRKLGRIGGTVTHSNEAGESASTTSATTGYRSNSLDSHAVPKPSRRKLGRIGGSLTENSGEDTSQASTKTVAHDDATEPTPTVASRKLGRIGGRAKTNTQSAVQSTEDEQAQQSRKSFPLSSEDEDQSQTSAKKGKPSISTVDVNHSRNVVTERSPILPETAEQKADKKREELKRQLDEKNKAPVKKKRRF